MGISEASTVRSPQGAGHQISLGLGLTDILLYGFL